LNYSAIAKAAEGDVALWDAGRNLFGSWSAAVEAAGLDYPSICLVKPNPYATRPAVTRELRRRHRAGLPLVVAEVRLGPHKDKSLLWAAVRLFGTWREALRTAKLDPKAITLESMRRKHRRANSKRGPASVNAD